MRLEPLDKYFISADSLLRDSIELGLRVVRSGFKPTFLAQHGHDVINPKLPDEDFEYAVKIAQEEFAKHRPQAVGVGDVLSSAASGGALVAVLFRLCRLHFERLF